MFIKGLCNSYCTFKGVISSKTKNVYFHMPEKWCKMTKVCLELPGS